MFRTRRILVTLILIALGVIGWLHRRTLRLEEELDQAQNPRDAVVRVRVGREPVDLRFRRTRVAEWIAPVVTPQEIDCRVEAGASREVELPAGIWSLSGPDGERPLLLLSGDRLELDLDHGRLPAGMVRIPAGPYLAGLSLEMRRTPSFLISRTETSVAEYRRFLQALGRERGLENGAIEAAGVVHTGFSRFCGEEERRDFPDGCPGHRPRDASRDLWAGLDQPGLEGVAVRLVTWYDAVAYCAWRSADAESQGLRLKFRLPRKDEWEKGARGVDGRPFPWGFEAGNVQQRVIDGGFLPVDGGDEARSPYGLRHCGTSVAEWCADADGPYRRVVMGTTWDIQADRVHVGFGIGESPDFRGMLLGFRVVADEVP